MLETALLVLVLLLSAVAVALSIVIWIHLRRPSTAGEERMASAERQITSQLAAGTTELAGRLERVKGELLQSLADRVTQGLDSVRSGVETQLTGGRQEQERRLGETVSRLESKFDALTEGQSRGQLAGRQEMTAALSAATRTLEEKFTALETRTSGTLETIRAKVDERLAVISENVQKKLDENIKEGFAQFEKVQQHLKAAEEQLRNVGTLGTSINDLNNLLKLPHLRGKFGEASLERLLADFLPAHLFEMQACIGKGEAGRVDAILKLPDRVLPIDSKFPREQVLPLFESSDPAQLDAAREQLARVIKTQADSIADKYIRPDLGTTDMALMYLPSETLWFEVTQHRELSEHLAKRRVFPVSPNTLLLALQTILLTYRWQAAAAGFRNTAAELARARQSFEHFQTQFENLGKNLQKAQDAYQTASGHLGRYQGRVTRLTGDPAAECEEEKGAAELPLLSSSPAAPAISPRHTGAE